MTKERNPNTGNPITGWSGVKINQIELNIGLENNPWPDLTSIKYFCEMMFDRVHSVNKYVGEWEGKNEDTAVILVLASTTLEKAEILENIRKLCVIFKQDAIATLLDNSQGYLIYHPLFEEEKLEFNRKYFIDTYNKEYNKNFK